MEVVLVGFGNVGSHFYTILTELEHQVTVLTRKTEPKLPSESQIQDISEFQKKIDLILLCVSDNSISEVALSLSRKIDNEIFIAHTSGILSADILKPFSNRACIYPLISIKKQFPLDKKNIPFILEGSNEEICTNIKHIATQISSLIPIFAKNREKEYIHLVAVFLNNFTNHIAYLGTKISDSKSIPFHIFLPLLNQTFENIQYKKTLLSQTGPAHRNDSITIENHLELLKDFSPQLTILYQYITQSIIKTTGKRK